VSWTRSSWEAGTGLGASFMVRDTGDRTRTDVKEASNKLALARIPDSARIAFHI